MATTFLVGATGMVGSQILAILRKAPTVSHIDTITRRNLPPNPIDPADTKVTSIVETDTEKWADRIRELKPAPQIYFCTLATTAGAVGLEKQFKLEHDLNVELAKTAREAGTKIFVLISMQAANPQARLPYLRLKGKIEESIKNLDFDHTIFIRPGIIGGRREESRPAEAIIRRFADVLGAVHSTLKDPWTQDADAIAKASLGAALKVLNGTVTEKVWTIAMGDIVKEGKEWDKQIESAASS